MTKNILAVDDEKDVLYTIKNGLEDSESGYEINCVDSGEKCFEFLKNNKIPDLILLDIMMPEMSGWEVLKRIKENPSWEKIPIIFLTARTDRVAENAGGFLAEDYIEKPFKITDLQERMEKILNKS